jgi:hypothetical protein
MPGTQPLCAGLRDKILEQLERTAHLLALLPADPDALTGHLLECMAGVCAVLCAAAPERLSHFAELRRLPVNHACTPVEAIERIAVYRAHIEEGFAAITDSDLTRLIPTVFVPRGETLLTLFLGNLEHLINHKHELFTRLKQSGVRVGTPDLYRLRGVE